MDPDLEQVSPEDDAAFDAGLDAALGDTPSPVAAEPLPGEVTPKPGETAPTPPTPKPTEQPKPGEAPIASEPKPVKKEGLELEDAIPPKPGEEKGKKKAPAKPEPTAEDKAKEIEGLNLDTLQPPPDSKPGVVANFSKVREAAKHWQTKAAVIPQLEQQVAELTTKAQQAITKLPPEIEQELQEHRDFRKIFDAENSAEFKEQFDGKLAKIDTDLLGYLGKNGLPEKLATEMKELGLNKISGEWWQKHILDKLPAVQRQRVVDYLTEREKTEDGKAEAVSQFATKKEEWLKGADERKTKEFQGYRKSIDDHVTALTKDVAWCQPKEVPADATDEQKAAIKAHNDALPILRQQFEDALFPKTPQAHAEIAMAAVASTKLAADVTNLATRLKEANGREEALKQEIETLKSKGRMPRGEAPRKQSDAPVAGKELSDDEAIEQGLDNALNAL